MELPGQVALVTGATGFVGRRTAQRLVLEGMRVRGLVRGLVELPDLERYLGDVTDAAAVTPAAVGAHVVVHCAAVLHRAARAEAMRVNVEGTRLVLEAALQAGCERFIHRRWLGVGPLPSMPFEAVPPGYRWRGRCSGEKATRELGYMPRVTYEEAMAEAERYLRESGLVKE